MSWANENDSVDHSVDGPGSAKAYVVDIPENGAPTTVTYVPNKTSNLFCSGHTFLPDGRLLVTGGDLGGGNGIVDTNLFDFHTLSWEAAAPMNEGRWYPTTITLANGEALTVGGLINVERGYNLLPQVWKVGGGWRDLSTAVSHVELYSPMHAAPNGKVFMSGSDVLTRYLDTTGTGAWSDVAWHNHGSLRDYGSSVMYDDGKILILGGGDPPTNTAETIDLYEAAPKWKYTAPMKFARRHQNATLMADGKILVTGGTSSRGFNDASQAALPAETWDPKTGRWTTMASMNVPRIYHSTAILLPDGRVLAAGGGAPAPVNGVQNFNAEIFSPPYLFNGPRPVITSAPDTVRYGEKFFVQVPNAGEVVKATWIRLSSATHAINLDQRINQLGVAATNGGLVIRAPSDPNLTPPGHYMLFLINAKGVPSISRIVRIL